MKIEKPSDQEAFYKELEKRIKEVNGDYCVEDFAFDLFVKVKSLKRKLKRLKIRIYERRVK